MCRVVAIISENTHTLLDRIERMTKSMAHGGPDGMGHLVNESLGYALGHRRLSIIDTSEHAAQPMHSENHRYCISYNGEIYNYRELRKELQQRGYQFKTASDTEVLLAGYDAWGAGMLPKLKGMFAFVLADNVDNKIVVARDHMGIKPLYMAKRGGDIYFSSEVKGLLAVDSSWEPNLEWRVWFLTFGFLPEPITTLENVWPIKKGHYIIYDLSTDTYQEHPWFSSLQKIDPTITTEEALVKTKNIVREAIERHLVADVKLGVFLSGGIDSSLVSILASKANPHQPIETLSIDFEDATYSEKKYQQTIVDLIGSNHHSLVVTQSDFAKAWHDIQSSLDQPTTDAINHYFVCRFANEKGCKVVLSGLGADELFGGYPSFNRTKQIDRLKMFTRLQILQTGIAGLLPYPKRKIDFFKKQLAASEYLTYRGLFTPADTARILHITEQEVWKILSTYQMPDEYDQIKGAKNRVAAFECNIYMLGQLLKDADMQSMWHSVELRVPFLDIDLVNMLHRLPEDIKYPAGGHKYLLVEAFKDLLPASIVHRKKQGFVFPFDTWLSNIKALHQKQLVPTKYFDQFLNGNLTASRIWGIYLSNTYGVQNSFNTYLANSKPSVLFIYLSAFCNTGGIEKINKLIIHSFKEEGSSTVMANSYGLHDVHLDGRYTLPYSFKGFSGKIIPFLIQLSAEAKHYDRVIVGHINLAPAVWVMKLLNKNLQIVLMAHGIEVWGAQKGFKKWLMHAANKIISVSNYSKQKMITESAVDPMKITVLHNALDPYFKKPDVQKNTNYLRKRYGIQKEDQVLVTVTRMSSAEKYKGYDQVLTAMAGIENGAKKNIKYILAGKADASENERISKLIEENQLEKQVIRPGFISDDELQDHYQLADLFIMPSKMEGFGIVLIEAAASEAKVMAGDGDGSKEALQNGKFGQLVDPDNSLLLQAAIQNNLSAISNPMNGKQLLYQEAYEYYSAVAYMKRFKNIALA